MARRGAALRARRPPRPRRAGPARAGTSARARARPHQARRLRVRAAGDGGRGAAEPAPRRRAAATGDLRAVRVLMRRAIVTLLVTAGVVYLLASFKPHVAALNAGVLPRSTTAPQARATRTPAKRRRRAGPTRATATGDAIQFQYGVLQLKATLTAGRLSGVTVVRLEPEPGRSEFIDAQAIPLLRAEALRARSANIDVVSGATYTSEAYARSLQAAIDRAQAA